MCLYPKLIRNKKYTSNKKNGGNIPAVRDKRVLMVPVGCGKCMECMNQKKREWQVRLTEEIKHDKTGKFVTFTFSNQEIKKLNKEIKGLTGYELDNEIATLAVRRFLERWRRKYKKSVKHWLITELGQNGTENIHLHGIIFTDKTTEEINERWKYGFTWIGEYVSERTINYIIKYVSKTDEKHKEYKPKILTSAGIGKKYIGGINAENNKYKDKKTKDYYKTKSGHKIALPIYYRNKLYNDEERENLWLNMLDKNERWVGGEKIHIHNDEEYYKTLQHYRAKNKRLGYGDDSKNWERKRYENERRRINLKKRIKNG